MKHLLSLPPKKTVRAKKHTAAIPKERKRATHKSLEFKVVAPSLPRKPLLPEHEHLVHQTSPLCLSPLFIRHCRRRPFFLGRLVGYGIHPAVYLRLRRCRRAILERVGVTQRTRERHCRGHWEAVLHHQLVGVQVFSV